MPSPFLQKRLFGVTKRLFSSAGAASKPAAPVLISVTQTVSSYLNFVFSSVPSATSYQLFKDGVFATTITSGGSYGPGDDSSHSYTIKAVNAAGLSPASNAISAAINGLYDAASGGVITDIDGTILTAA